MIKKLQTIFRKSKGEIIPISNLGKIFGSKNLFNEILTLNYKIRDITTKRIEQKLHDLLVEPYLSEALVSLDEYRKKRGYLKNKGIQNQEENELIRIL